MAAPYGAQKRIATTLRPKGDVQPRSESVVLGTSIRGLKAIELVGE
jgi:hypothetical protein